MRSCLRSYESLSCVRALEEDGYDGNDGDDGDDGGGGGLICLLDVWAKGTLGDRFVGRARLHADVLLQVTDVMAVTNLTACAGVIYLAWREVGGDGHRSNQRRVSWLRECVPCGGGGHNQRRAAAGRPTAAAAARAVGSAHSQGRNRGVRAYPAPAHEDCGPPAP